MFLDPLCRIANVEIRFHRDLAANKRIPGPIDKAHPSLAKGCGNLVVAKQFSE
jgi:hypothetical protein